MRFLLMLAIAVSASLAIAQELSSDPPRASELQGPIQASPFATQSPANAPGASEFQDPTPIAPRASESQAPPRPSEYPTATPPDVAGEAPASVTSAFSNTPFSQSKANVCVTIEQNSFTIRFGVKTPLSLGSESLSTFIICNKVTATGSDTDPSTVNCTNCKVMLPGGNHGMANDASYDSKTDTLTLRGSKDKPVKLTMVTGGVPRTMTAAEIAVELNTDAATAAPPQITPQQPASQDDDLFSRR